MTIFKNQSSEVIEILERVISTVRECYSDEPWGDLSVGEWLTHIAEVLSDGEALSFLEIHSQEDVEVAYNLVQTAIYKIAMEKSVPKDISLIIGE